MDDGCADLGDEGLPHHTRPLVSGDPHSQNPSLSSKDAATIPLSYSLSCLTLRAHPQVKMTPDGSRLPVDDRSGKRLPLTAGSSGRALGPRDRRHRRRSSSVSCSTWSYPVSKSGRYDYTGNHHRSSLVPRLAAWSTAPPPSRGCSVRARARQTKPGRLSIRGRSVPPWLE